MSKELKQKREGRSKDYERDTDSKADSSEFCHSRLEFLKKNDCPLYVIRLR